MLLQVLFKSIEDLFMHLMEFNLTPNIDQKKKIKPLNGIVNLYNFIMGLWKEKDSYQTISWKVASIEEISIAVKEHLHYIVKLLSIKFCFKPNHN